MLEHKRDGFDAVATNCQDFSRQPIGGLIEAIIAERHFFRLDSQPVAAQTHLFLKPIRNRLFDLRIGEHGVYGKIGSTFQPGEPHLEGSFQSPHVVVIAAEIRGRSHGRDGAATESASLRSKSGGR